MSQLPNINNRSGGGWAHNQIGAMRPMHTGGMEREILRVHKDDEIKRPGAHALSRSSLSKEEAALLGRIDTIAGDVESIQNYIIDVVASSLGEGGLARYQFLQYGTGLVVPNAGPTNRFHSGRDGHDTKQSRKILNAEEGAE
jgi:hypothetical protein